jgi:hypothetical protein
LNKPRSIILSTETGPGPLDIIIELEQRRIRLGKKKEEVCTAAGIKPEMYSYTLKRGRSGKSLPQLCVDRIRNGLGRLERQAIRKQNRKKETS